MLGLGFADQKLPRSTIHTQHDTHESNSSIFRSDAHVHEFIISQLSKDLAVCDASCGPDKHPIRTFVRKNSNPIKKNSGKLEVAQGEEEEEDDDKETIENPQTNSLFCPPKETLARKQERRRPASLDLNSRGHAACSSPRFAAMKKTSAASRRPGTFPSPGTPSYCQKGWNSERVPLPANCSRRNGNAVLMPFNNGRSLPSKWEDAEKWIFSPVAGDGVSRPPPLIPPQQRRPKSKSGPLGGLGIANYSSPSMIPVFDGGRVGNFMGNSPFSAGVLVPGRAFEGGGSYPVHTEPPWIGRSASVHGWSDMLIQSSLPKDEKDGTKDAGTMIAPVLSRRDMATQMSPVHSIDSSPKERPSCSASGLEVLPVEELQSHHPSKLEVKDVQVDDHVTVTRWSKKHGARGLEKCAANIGEWKKKVVEVRASAWEIAETEKCISKFRRDEANIMAWENLQKAKAEAEIRKLEMKLEKMRTSSMDKIMKKLRLAQKKAQEMRSSVSANEVHEVTMTAKKGSILLQDWSIGILDWMLHLPRLLVACTHPSASSSW